MLIAETPFAVFHREYFGPIDQYMAWRNGFRADFACLDALAPTDRAQATSELLAALRTHTGDARVLLGLGHLRCAEALPLLHDALRRRCYSVYALEAIAQIDPASLQLDLVASLLSPKAKESLLIDLLVGLREYFLRPQLGPAIPPRIFALLVSRRYLVRYHALATLRCLYGLQTAEQQRFQDIETVRADKLFQLIARKGWFVDYSQAQLVLLSQLPPALRLTLAAR